MLTELDDAYELLHRWGPEFGGDEEGNNGLTNHGPMAAEVLVRRGFADLVPGWVEGYVPRLLTLPEQAKPIDPDRWHEAMGDGRRVADWVGFFIRELDQASWADVLAQWWPRLLPGIVAGSTHGVIRVGHAVRTLRDGDTSRAAVDELAHGLAFWAARSRLIPRASTPQGNSGPVEALAGIPHLEEQRGLIAQRLGRLDTLPGWPQAQRALRRPVDDDDAAGLLEDLVHAATVRYLQFGYGSPVLLVHTATAPNAVLHTLPSLPRSLWQPSVAAVWSASAAIVAAYEPSTAAPRSKLAIGESSPDDVIERAARHGDEHVVKFTDTAAEVYERSGDPDALAAADRIRELIDPR